jgi:hypothetical protein
VRRAQACGGLRGAVGTSCMAEVGATGTGCAAEAHRDRGHERHADVHDPVGQQQRRQVRRRSNPHAVHLRHATRSSHAQQRSAVARGHAGAGRRQARRRRERRSGHRQHHHVLGARRRARGLGGHCLRKYRATATFFLPEFLETQISSIVKTTDNDTVTLVVSK